MNQNWNAVTFKNNDGQVLEIRCDAESPDTIELVVEGNVFWCTTEDSVEIASALAILYSGSEKMRSEE